MLWCVAGVVAHGLSSDCNAICRVKQPGLLGLIDPEGEDARVV